MKKTILKFGVIALGVLPMVSCSDDDNSDETLITAEELPDIARNFISTYFPAADFNRIEENTTAESDGTLYEVELNNNFEVDFTAEGDWVDIDGNDQKIPEGIVPENIAGYIGENYPDLFITGIDTNPNGFELELSNDLEVLFDTEGIFTREDK